MEKKGNENKKQNKTKSFFEQINQSPDTHHCRLFLHMYIKKNNKCSFVLCGVFFWFRLMFLL